MSPEQRAAILNPAILELVDDASKFFNEVLALNRAAAATDLQLREITPLVIPRMEALIREWALGDHDDAELRRRARATYVEIACAAMGLQPVTATAGSAS